MWTLPTLLMCILMVLAVLGTAAKARESFSTVETKSQLDVYDEPYARIYDLVTYDHLRTEQEVAVVTNLTTEESRVLDVGCGMGHYVAQLTQRGVDAVGLDAAPAMVKGALAKYPQCAFEEGNALFKQRFASESFTHILCLNNTLLDMKHKNLFFENAHYWLEPGGFLVAHLNDDLLLLKKRANARANFEYTSAMVGNTLYETFSGPAKKRRNEHRYYTEPTQYLVNMVKQAGFVLFSTNSNLYVFQKS